MKAEAFSNGELIGRVDLRIGDYGLGGLFGSFSPTNYYLDYIRKQVWMFNSTDKGDDSETWKSLNIHVKLGGLILKHKEVTILDLPTMFRAFIQIELAGVDSSLIDKAFNIR